MLLSFLVDQLETILHASRQNVQVKVRYTCGDDQKETQAFFVEEEDGVVIIEIVA